jgi:RNA polymerase sigma-70 factor (ECF subfamily)
MQTAAHHRAELAARTSYGRLLAILVARTRDIAAAEDALSAAFEAALRVWPERGTPANPEAWLITAARNTLSNLHRHAAVQTAAEPELLRRADERTASADFPDERLKLLFLCAHPAIDEQIRTPLMLQTVLGLDAARIARAFLIPPATMGQRLVRAKTKIRDAGLRLVLTQAELGSDRLLGVLDAIYVAFGTGWDATDDTASLVPEAIYLARLTAHLLPAEPEPQGLLALMLYSAARGPARHDAQGGFVPLDRQDTGLWNRDMIIEAEGLLTAASRHGRFGRYLCEAAIQSVHAQRGITGQTNHQALALLYGLLHRHAPSVGAATGLAAVLAETGRTAQALALLDSLPPGKAGSYQPYWVTRARVLRASGDLVAAQDALDQAISLTPDATLRRHLLAQA